MSGDYVSAEKGGVKTRFTRFIWDKMGNDKNGWKLVQGGAEKAKPNTTAKPKKKGKPEGVKADHSAANHKQLLEQAAGFEADGKLEKALEKYAAALQLKNTKAVAETVERLTEALYGKDEDDLVGFVDETLVSADAAYEDEDYVLAKELYEAVEDQENEHVKSRLAAIAEHLKN